MGAQQSLKERFQVLDERVHLDHYRLGELLAAEGQQLTRSIRRALGGLHNPRDVGAPRVVRRQTFQDKVREAEHPHHGVVDVVGHAASQLPHRLHLRGLTKPRLGQAPIGHIAQRKENVAGVPRGLDDAAPVDAKRASPQLPELVGDFVAVERSTGLNTR
jgi:hypothetical protein